jgi:hypothetical protein
MHEDEHRKDGDECRAASQPLLDFRGEEGVPRYEMQNSEQGFKKIDQWPEIERYSPGSGVLK